MMKADCPSWVVTHLRQTRSNPQKCTAWSVFLLNEGWHGATASQSWTSARARQSGTGVRSFISGGYKAMAQCHAAEHEAKHVFLSTIKMSNAWLYWVQTHHCAQGQDLNMISVVLKDLSVLTHKTIITINLTSPRIKPLLCKCIHFSE